MKRRTFIKTAAAAVTAAATLPVVGAVERHLCRTLGKPKFYEPKPGDYLRNYAKHDAEVTYALQADFLVKSTWNRNLYGAPKA